MGPRNHVVLRRPCQLLVEPHATRGGQSDSAAGQRPIAEKTGSSRFCGSHLGGVEGMAGMAGSHLVSLLTQGQTRIQRVLQCTFGTLALRIQSEGICPLGEQKSSVEMFLSRIFETNDNKMTKPTICSFVFRRLNCTIQHIEGCDQGTLDSLLGEEGVPIQYIKTTFEMGCSPNFCYQTAFNNCNSEIRDTTTICR